MTNQWEQDSLLSVMSDESNGTDSTLDRAMSSSNHLLGGPVGLNPIVAIRNRRRKTTELDAYQVETLAVKRITQRDTRRIRLWRFVIGLFIAGSGALVSWKTYRILNKQVVYRAEAKFNDLAKSIRYGSMLHFGNMFQACRDLAFTITAHAVYHNLTFPFVTIPNWEVHAGEARQRGALEAITYHPWLRDAGMIQEFNHYASEHSGWQQESIQDYRKLNHGFKNVRFAVSTETMVYVRGGPSNQSMKILSTATPSLPVWTQSPPPQAFSAMMYDMFSMWRVAVEAVESSREMVLGIMDTVKGRSLDAIVGPEAHNRYHARIRHYVDLSNMTTSDAEKSEFSYQAHGNIFTPVFTNRNTDTAEIGGLVAGIFGLDAFLADILPNGVRGIRVVIENSCNNSFSYELEGNVPSFMGSGDMGDPNYSHLKFEIPFDEVLYGGKDSLKWPKGYCSYRFIVSPASLYMQDNESSIPIVYSTLVAIIFGVMGIVVIFYDMQVQRRNNRMMSTAVLSRTIASSIFPAGIRERLFADFSSPNEDVLGAALVSSKLNPPTTTWQNEAKGVGDDNWTDDTAWLLSSKPIADFFPATTILFADICGFTAWSSVREPSQIFVLLETVYHAFDMVAKRRGVYKVETVGACYVAVCGLPDQRKDHAIIMTRFARECLSEMLHLTRRLEVNLGPGTGDLGLRVGLHSGPVTAGLLRGERSRFQLFGDAMNTASRMESTGEVNRVQVSEDTAKHLVSAGKGHWLIRRAHLVAAKGKGTLTTFWLKKSNTGLEKFSDIPLSSSRGTSMDLGERTRLITWVADVLFRTLTLVVLRRQHAARSEGVSPQPALQNYFKNFKSHLGKSVTILDEVEHVIEFHELNSNNFGKDNNFDCVDIPPVVFEELLLYVTEISQTYHDNPFHNFEHAAHVSMFVVKLLSRIVTPAELDFESFDKENSAGVSRMHDHTYGITSDPLIKFSCVLAALIHDVDHPGVSNAQLVEENDNLAVRYKGKSVAEQNSLDLAWNLLTEARFGNLQSVICTTEDEFRRFRQLVVNSVMATDIIDEELKKLRNARWEEAFSDSGGSIPCDDRLNVNRKATILIEYLIQASDVAHTMQHWSVYRKWNERFFQECFQAYKNGRAEKNPADYWYKGELDFFDFYIIPLAKKLQDCGVFGVFSTEYLNYAIRNREQWEHLGKGIVAEMVENQVTYE